ncbi:hypothetical protein [Moorena sp. SIO3H5]|uniref:hypothetical protein n=1 Tax=Moorena sp. SIO3H5 TaxID=2607834 RepID=UPI0013B77A85|nr:hypothetical protein [Moorena sp. SIO3H5]NEO74547.1 hypothetical protein [Moorena sp. SIO3H5]
MNIKRIFGTLVAFVFTVAVVFGLQVGSASAAPDASLSELSQGGTLIADVPGEKKFEFNIPYFLPKDLLSLTITDTPERDMTMVAQNYSPNYSAELLYTYSQDTDSFEFPANDRQTQKNTFNPKNSEIVVTNISTSPSSVVKFFFLP